MGDVLFLCHRIPYPPDKGEKIRAWHMLCHLARTRPVHLGCFLDDPADEAHVPALRALTASLAVIGLDRRRAKWRTLARARPGLPLSVGWFQDRRLAAWVTGTVASHDIRHVLAYSAAMAPYALTVPRPATRLLDMVDVDSEKWAEYARDERGPMRLVWAREARTLLGFERRMVRDFDHSLFVSEPEARRFLALAPEAAGRVGWLENGVDAGRFSPAVTWPDPFAGERGAIVFTGTMDYRPNVDAVTWFVREILPAIRARRPEARFHIVGANPAAAVCALAAHDVTVHGRVADMRPYLAHAALAVAPLRIARGIQNKVLEAMAMARPVLATPQAFEGIRAVPGRDLLLAADAGTMATQAVAVLDGGHAGLGAAARAAMQQGHDWERTLADLDTLLDLAPPQSRRANA